MVDNWITSKRLDIGVEVVRKNYMQRDTILHAIGEARIQYAIVGDQAAAWWVARKEETAPRFCSKLDLLVHPDESSLVRTALENLGLSSVQSNKKGQQNANDSFSHQDSCKLQPDVAVYYCGKTSPVRSAILPAPERIDTELSENQLHILSLPLLVQMLLSNFTLSDKVNLHDLLDIKLIDESWFDILPEILHPRLQQILNHPENGSFFSDED